MILLFAQPPHGAGKLVQLVAPPHIVLVRMHTIVYTIPRVS